MAEDVDRSGGTLVDASGVRLTPPFVTVPPGWGQNWFKARDEAGTRPVVVQAWGDSITAGQGATNPVTGAYIARLGDVLRARYGDGGTGFLPWGANTTITGTWTVGMGFGGGAGTSTAAASLSFANLAGTTLRIYHRNTNITGTFRWRIDGGSFTNVTPPTGFGVEPGFVEVTGLADVPHTIDVEWVSGTVTIHGVAAVRSTGIVMQRCAQSGRCGGDYSRVTQGSLTIGTTDTSTTITSAAPGAFTSSLIGRYLRGTGIPVDTTITAPGLTATSATISKAATATGTVTVDFGRNPTSNPGVPAGTVEAPFGLAPALGRADLLIIALGANDPSSGYTPANLVDGLGAILRPHTTGNILDYSPDVVVLIEHFGNWFDVPGVWPALTSALASVAESHGAALVDVWGMGRRSFKFWDDRGYFADTIHPSDAGHAQYAAPLIDLLTAA